MASRGPKGKITQQPPDMFIALGSKQSASRDNDPKRTGPSLQKPSTSGKGQIDRKRENTTPLPAGPALKKMKVALPTRPTTTPAPCMSTLIPTERSNPGQSSAEAWEAMAVDCEACDFMELVMNSVHIGNTEKAVSYILGAIRSIKVQRFKPCKVLYSNLLLLVYSKPTLFVNENVVAALISSIRRDIIAGLKAPTKNNPHNQMLFINILLYAFNSVGHWPESFVKLYVEDAVGDRVWIDNPFCKPFVDNISTAFNTKQPPKLLLATETWAPAGRDTSSPLTINSNDDDESMNEFKSIVSSWNINTYSRYTQAQEIVEQICLEAIKEQLTRRQQPDAITKNFVRFLSIASGLVEIRIIAVSRIENWLHNHKLMKPAQELLAYLCYNCSTNTQRDLEVVAHLSKLRIKNKPMITFFNNCLKEMVLSFPENLYPLLKYTVYNELSNTRNTNNLLVVGAMFQVSPEGGADAFTDICLELLLNKDDYLRSIRTLLKEINRVLKQDFNLCNVVHSLLKERKEMSNLIRDSEFKDRIFLSLVDLVCMCMFLCISPQVRDAASQSKKDASIFQHFQLQVSNIQREAAVWLHEGALRTFRPHVSDFQYAIHKVLLLEPVEQYCKVDSWPGENERNLFFRLISEVPLLEQTLFRTLVIGISKEHPVSANDIVDICDQLVRRAGNLTTDSVMPLVMDKLEIVDLFFNLCCYNYPENITLPVGYTPPKLAISSIYWKSWLILLIIAAHNPSTFGSLAWSKYRILRMFMEMCITNHFTFPPSTMLSTEATEEFIGKEQQMLAIERQKILEFETHLAAASTKQEINEQTSLLLPQLIELNPTGDIRRPPPLVLEQLQALNNTHRLGHLLCRSRSPDFLLDIMSSQGGVAHMPWLAELVHNSEGALAHLPVQCLCEYLLTNTPTEKLTKHSQLLAHLRTVVHGSDGSNSTEVLEYLLRRLTSPHASSRNRAIKGLTLVLNTNEDGEITAENVNQTHWLTHYISYLPNINNVRHILIHLLMQATLVETNPVHISNYINYLATKGIDGLGELELIFDLASLIVERNSITTYILPGENMRTLRDLISIFYTYLHKVRQPPDENFMWPAENQDQVVVTWGNGDQCVIQVLVIQASIILLTYGPLEDSEEFNALLDMWFPLNEDRMITFFPDTADDSILLPDWLKLRMIRSNVLRLVDLAVEKLNAQQLVLFIQSFGIPVVSISKLLQTLDKATTSDPKLVVHHVLDKNYMIQLVEVQNRRGAVGGEIFVRALEMESPLIKDDDAINVAPARKTLPIKKKKPGLSDNSVDSLMNCLAKIFSGYSGGSTFEDIIAITQKMKEDSHFTQRVIHLLCSIPPLAVIQVVLEKKSLFLLLRLIFVKENCNQDTLRLASRLLDTIQDKSCPLAIVFAQFLEMNLKQSKPHEAEKNDFSKKLKNKDPQDNRTLEELGREFGKVLMENPQFENAGSLVDWLMATELHVSGSNQQLQMELLFSKKNLRFRPLLLSVLLQRASWNTLGKVVGHLLEDDSQSYCPIAVLDFLTALTQSPKLWQGRDKATPKHYHSEDILCLTMPQILKMVDYILEEAELEEHDFIRKMESRLPVLISCENLQLSIYVKHLMKKTETNPMAKHLLLISYMEKPNIRKYLPKDYLLSEIQSDMTPSAADIISHTLISSLTATTKYKDWTTRHPDLERCVRKLASMHPELILRQLTMIAGSLRGRAQYDWPVFKNRGHLTLFAKVLGLLELLQPHIFQKTDVLYNILDSYFQLLKYHGHMKELTTPVNRLVRFLQNWMIKDVQYSLKYLQEKGHILNEIQSVQPSVRSLLSSVSFPSQDRNEDQDQIVIRTPTPPDAEHLPQQWPMIINGLQSADPLLALQELEYICNKKPQFLQPASQYLYNNINSSNGAVRELALRMLLKLLKFDPSVSEEALPSVLSCLESRNADVVENILTKLPQLVVSMQEHAMVILRRIFRLGLVSQLNTTNALTKSIGLLNLQSGY
nr:integrator complex subunit 1 [Onthophagus taurus]